MMHILTAWLLAFSLCLSPVMSAKAQAAAAQPGTPASIATTADSPAGDACSGGPMLQPRYADAETTAVYSQRIQASERFGRFATTYLSARSGEFAPQMPALSVLEVPEFDAVGVYLPLSGPVGDYSFYAEWYEKASGKLIISASVLFSRDQAGNIIAEIERDEQPAARVTLAPDGDVLAGTIWVDGAEIAIAPTPYDSSGVIDFFGCTLDCLLDNGVPEFVVSLLVKICSFLCGIFTPVGSPCWLCYVLYIGVWLPKLLTCWVICAPQQVFLPLVARPGKVY
jgi:hypothetical protein